MRSSLLAALALWPLGALAQSTCPATQVWPGDDWASTPSTNASAIAAMENYAFTLTGTDADHAGVRTDAVLIIQHGQIIYEKYGRGWTKDQAHEGWSVTKSVTSALTGIAVGSGKLGLDETICDFFPQPQQHCDITPRNLLEFASGLDWLESYEGKSNQASSVIAMLYGVGHQDMASFVLSHPSRSAPGGSYSYSTGDATLLGAVVDLAMKPNFGDDYAWTKLFDPIGMKSAVLERDVKGNSVGGAFVYATARDYARFGYFYLNDGCWNGTRILPVGWVSQSTSINDPITEGTLYEWSPGDVQGWMWWLNLPLPSRQQPQPWPGVPQGAFQANGHWGQTITIIPAKDMVIVRLADDRDTTYDQTIFLPLAMAVGD